ncbi:MAG: PAS domain S-box protein [Deltaproteobacteria bacterium]|nr:PAS domain S-box protein [Deltaproteobacteria bacterium]
MTDDATLGKMAGMNDEALEVLRGILENTKFAITVSDVKGVLTLFNRAAERYTGYSRSEVLDKPVGLFFVHPDRVADVFSAANRMGALEDYQTNVIRKDGQLLPVSMYLTPIFDVLGRPAGHLSVTTDLSERRRLEAELANQKRRAEFYTDLICHDVRNYDQTIFGYLDLLLEAGLGEVDDDLASVARAVRCEANRLKQFVEFVRVVGGRERASVPSVYRLRLRDVVSGILDRLSGPCTVMENRVPEDAFIEGGWLLEDVLSGLLDVCLSDSEVVADRHVWIRVERIQDEAGDGVALWRLAIEDDCPMAEGCCSNGNQGRGADFEDSVGCFDEGQTVTGRSQTGVLSGTTFEELSFSLAAMVAAQYRGRASRRLRVPDRPQEGQIVVMEFLAWSDDSDDGASDQQGPCGRDASVERDDAADGRKSASAGRRDDTSDDPGE